MPGKCEDSNHKYRCLGHEIFEIYDQFLEFEFKINFGRK